jgi:hypothetical protein
VANFSLNSKRKEQKCKKAATSSAHSAPPPGALAQLFTRCAAATQFKFGGDPPFHNAAAICARGGIMKEAE